MNLATPSPAHRSDAGCTSHRYCYRSGVPRGIVGCGFPAEWVLPPARPVSRLTTARRSDSRGDDRHPSVLRAPAVEGARHERPAALLAGRVDRRHRDRQEHGVGMFRALGCVIIDADLLAREVVEPGKPAYTDIVAEFGSSVVQADRALDRKRLGAIVFADPAPPPAGSDHPPADSRAVRTPAARAGRPGFRRHRHLRRARHDRERQLPEHGPAGGGGDGRNDPARPPSRAGSADGDVARRIASQMPLAEKVKLADYVIDNTGERSATEDQVRRVHAALMAELRARRIPRGDRHPAARPRSALSG